MSSSVVDTGCVEELYNCVGWELPNSIIILLGVFLPAYIRGLINTISRVFSTWAATQYTYCQQSLGCSAVGELCSVDGCGVVEKLCSIQIGCRAVGACIMYAVACRIQQSENF